MHGPSTVTHQLSQTISKARVLAAQITHQPPQSTVVVTLASCCCSLPTFGMPQLLHCVHSLFCAFMGVQHLSVMGACLSTGWYLCRSAESLSCCRFAPSRLEHDFFCRDNVLSSTRIRHCETSLHHFPRSLRLKHVVDTTGVSTVAKVSGLQVMPSGFNGHPTAPRGLTDQLCVYLLFFGDATTHISITLHIVASLSRLTKLNSKLTPPRQNRLCFCGVAIDYSIQMANFRAMS